MSDEELVSTIPADSSATDPTVNSGKPLLFYDREKCGIAACDLFNQPKLQYSAHNFFNALILV